MKSCKECYRYQWCVTLCERARRYVSKDEVKQRELPIGIPIFGGPLPILPTKITLTESQKKLGKLLVRKINRRNISSLTGISRHTVSNRIYQMKRIYYGGDFLPKAPQPENFPGDSEIASLELKNGVIEDISEIRKL